MEGKKKLLKVWHGGKLVVLLRIYGSFVVINQPEGSEVEVLDE